MLGGCLLASDSMYAKVLGYCVHLTRPHGHNVGVAHVRDLGHQRGGEEDVL